MNLANVIESHASDQVALISRGRTTTYGELSEQVARLRGGLLRLGLEPGERVAIVAANNWYAVVSYLAVIGSGALLRAAEIPYLVCCPWIPLVWICFPCW